MIHSALYVARSALAAEDPLAEVARFGDAARDWNRRMGITGVLIVTPLHYAHLFEGPEPAVSRVLEVIPEDGFHRDIRVLRRTLSDARRFSRWQIGYQGGSSYVDRHIAPLFADRNSKAGDQQIEKLIDLLTEMGRL